MSVVWKVVKAKFNRNIVECKYIHSMLAFLLTLNLIET